LEQSKPQVNFSNVNASTYGA